METRLQLAPFVDATLDLALATIAMPEEDPAPLVLRVRESSNRAIQALPSLAGVLEGAVSPAQASVLCRRLARHARTIMASLLPKGTVIAGAKPASGGYEPYTTIPASALEEPDPSRLWLVENLWQRSGTGIVGGSAKGAKTWLCLDLALSIASNTPALDRFAVHRPGGVLFVSAEGGQAYLKGRLNALCAHRGLKLDSLPHRLDMISTAIRIDTPEGLGRLEATIEAVRPVLLVLDPIVRLHRIDENSASSVSALLSSLTELQQRHDLAILVAHHSTKQGARRSDPSGQDFRGSSDFYAWGDSNIFVRKKDGRFSIAAEHRAAPSSDKWTLEATTDEHPRLRIVDDEIEDSSSPASQPDKIRLKSEILKLVTEGAKASADLRKTIKGSNGRIGEAVRELEAEGRIVKAGRRWAATNGTSSHLS
jgi:hypothetical protein